MVNGKNLEFKKILLKRMVNKFYKEAEKSANTACAFWHNQPKQPEMVKKLKKF